MMTPNAFLMWPAPPRSPSCREGALAAAVAASPFDLWVITARPPPKPKPLPHPMISQDLNTRSPWRRNSSAFQLHFPWLCFFSPPTPLFFSCLLSCTESAASFVFHLPADSDRWTRLWTVFSDIKSFQITAWTDCSGIIQIRMLTSVGLHTQMPLLYS